VAEIESTGNLRFVGRKSEVIVTAAGVNLHPEDLEAAVEQQPGVAACAVVPMETAAGTEPCAVLACYGAGEQAAAAIASANARLAEFQQLRRWVLWPEPDLPRTSTGKVKRKEVEAWLARIQAAASNGGASAFTPSSDWLLTLIAQIAGEVPAGIGDELRLTEDLHLDSLGLVQLAAALEERLGLAAGNGLLEQVQTLGELRGLLAGNAYGARAAWTAPLAPDRQNAGSPAAPSLRSGSTQNDSKEENEPAQEQNAYPRWAWSKPLQWLRTAFVEAALRPLVGLLANPRVVAPHTLAPNTPMQDAPMLIVANHVTAFDGPLVQYALPGPIRRHIAAAMSAEMLADYRHFRNPERGPRQRRFDLFGPLKYLLLTALFNVFPLPRKRDFQRSFLHAGAAMDHGYNVLVFPEGTRSAQGELAPFRGGIGMMARQSGAAVLPVAIRGLGGLKTGRQHWFRSGAIEVHVGEPIHFSPAETEAGITARLHAEVDKLLHG
jgi:long-chain acyl-CoA synthetase